MGYEFTGQDIEDLHQIPWTDSDHGSGQQAIYDDAERIRVEWEAEEKHQEDILERYFNLDQTEGVGVDHEKDLDVHYNEDEASVSTYLQLIEKEMNKIGS